MTFLVILTSFTSIANTKSASTEEFSYYRDNGWSFVSGSAVHYFSTSIKHQSTPTPTGKVELSTDTIDLTGDLTGRIVYHVTSTYDFMAAQLTNTGHQVFSGIILNSDPLLLLDDDFIFQVDLNTGATVGKVFLVQSIAGERIKCSLLIEGTGLDSVGNGLVDYKGYCKMSKSNKVR
jgi:hypothetical protein